MNSELLLAALRDDIEWPAATLWLLLNYLDPQEESFQRQSECLGNLRDS